jgi:hypothetical protein
VQTAAPDGVAVLFWYKMTEKKQYKYQGMGF